MASIRVQSRCGAGSCAPEGVEHLQLRKPRRTLEKMTDFAMDNPYMQFLAIFIILLSIAFLLAYHSQCSECNPVGRPIPGDDDLGLAPAESSDPVVI